MACRSGSTNYPNSGSSSSNASDDESVPMSITPSKLEGLVQARRAEARKKATQKRLADLQIIRDRNDPNSEGNFAWEIFPEELWKMILNELVDPRDLENARNTCRLFHAILEPRRIRDIYFPLALEIDEVRAALLETTIPPQDLPVISRRGILSLRSTCKSLRDSVDRRYDAILLRFGETDFRCIFHGDFPTLVRQLNSECRLPLLSGPSPRLVGRSLDISRYIHEGDGDYRDIILKFDADLRELLKTVGHEIWYFRLAMFDVKDLTSIWDFAPVELYFIIRRWVRHMPNLKFLDLLIEAGYDEWEPSSRDLKELEKGIKRRPFPRLEHLCKVRLDLPDPFVPAVKIFEEILRTNPHIRGLNCIGGFWELDEAADLCESIQSLELDSFAMECTASDQQYNWANPRWPLKQIGLTLRRWYKPEMRELFDFLQQFQTLEKVTLKVSRPFVRGVSKGLYLQLPNLKQFDFEYSAQTAVPRSRDPYFYTSIDYLLKQGQLEKITWINTMLKSFKDYKEDPNSLVTFEAGKGDLARSNIWQVFPSLRNVEVLAEDGENRNYRRGKIWRRGDHLPTLLPYEFSYHYDVE